MNFTKPGVRIDFRIGDFCRNFFEFEKKGEYINFLKLSAIIHLWHQGKMEGSKTRTSGDVEKDYFWFLFREEEESLILLFDEKRGKQEIGTLSEHQFLQPAILIFCLLLCISSYNRYVFLSNRNIFHSEHQFLRPTIIIFHFPLCISLFTRNVFPSDINVFLGVPQFLQTAIPIQPFSLSNPSSAFHIFTIYKVYFLPIV